MNLQDLQVQQKEWTAKNFPNQTGYQAVLGVCEESGELAHSVLKMEQGIRGSRTDHQLKMADAVGDIIIFLSAVCNHYGMDLNGCVDVAWNQVKQREWKTWPKDGTKY